MAASSASPARLLTRLKGRDKPQFSCNFCRRRKLRCDRRQPCDSCTRLGQASTCSFPLAQSLSPHKLPSIAPAVQSVLQERIDHLESLVRSLATKQQGTVGSSTPEYAQAPAAIGETTSQASTTFLRDFGRISLKDGESSYTESDHWTAILDEISDFRNMFQDHDDSQTLESQVEQQMHPGLGLFLDHSYPAAKMDILSALPPRPTVDGLIAKYFSTADMPVTLAIHRNVFIRQYESFWERPFETPVLWVAILFGMMFTVAYNTLFITRDFGSLDEATLSEYQNIKQIAREKMIKCLHLGNYMKGAPHTIEALLSLLLVEYLQGDDAQYGCWQLIGVTVRIALKMGYHRDGSHFPKMTSYEAEMRRRIWYILLQFDIASAAQVGLPRIIKEVQCNTEEPRSLFDDDFDESTATLPPARPDTEHTLAQFLIHKSRVVSVYGMICDFATSSRQRDYNEAMRLDAMLNDAYTQKPAILETKAMHRSILDGAQLITRRLYIAMSYRHAQMTLHRKFMMIAKTETSYAYSYTTCINAALAALQYQSDLFKQCQPGRMLHADRWKILSLVQSEFLLATSLLCVDLDHDLKDARWPHSPLVSGAEFYDHLEVLQSSRAIWSQQQQFSKEASEAVKVIDLILEKVKRRSGSEIPSSNLVSSSSRNGSTTATMSPVYNGNTSVAQSILSERVTTIGLLSSNFDHPIPQYNSFEDSLLPDSQPMIDTTNWNELFDFDASWDGWVQL